MSNERFEKDKEAQKAKDALREEEKKKEEELKAQSLAKENEIRATSNRLHAQQEAEEEAVQLAKASQKDEEEEIEQISLHLVDIKPWKKDSDDLVEDYQEKFPDRKLDAKRTLVFTSREEMEEFINHQAKLPPDGKGRKFIIAEVDENGQRLGQYHFSCGDGKVYSGSAEEIIAKLKENQATAAPNTQKLIADGLSMFERVLNPKPQPTVDTKKRLEALKSGGQSPAPTTAPKQEEEKEESEKEKYKSPSPFKTTP
ncbi:hypothetical protein [Legionella sp.]|uniref:hypothetical protein n=1 Tax=Legionella sp. TaxID=459 RepID=UPI000CC4193C|nr:hypothetical protein [Legionella sp.]PJE11496.1 MAG: hypothetical protein CK430_08830 [Legionella sp.]